MTIRRRPLELYYQARATPISPTGSARISASQRRFSTQSHCGRSVKSTRLCHLSPLPTPSSACSGPSFRLSALSDPAGVAALDVAEREGIRQRTERRAPQVVAGADRQVPFGGLPDSCATTIRATTCALSDNDSTERSSTWSAICIRQLSFKGRAGASPGPHLTHDTRGGKAGARSLYISDNPRFPYVECRENSSFYGAGKWTAPGVYTAQPACSKSGRSQAGGCPGEPTAHARRRWLRPSP